MSNKANVKISCGNLEAFLCPARFGPGGKSLCIKLEKTESSPWINLIDFEKKAGKGSQHNWKKTVKSKTHGNRHLHFLIEDGTLKACSDKLCKCRPCSLAKEGSSSANVSKSPSPRNQSSTPKAVTKVPAPNLANLKVEPKARDTDSDSGISVEISTGTSAPSTSIFVNEPLTTFEQEKPLPNYCRMVQEAIIALSLGVPSPEAPPGCSLLGIFLYILKHFPDARENVVVMNTKIRSTLALLKRMGIIDSLNDDEKDDLLITSDLPKVEEEPEEKAKVSKDSTPKAKVMKSKANLAAIEAKKKASKMIVKKAKVLNNKQGNGKKKKSGNAVLNSGSGKENSSSANKQPFNFAAQKPKKLSTALSSVCGGRKQMVRQEAVRAIWIYIKKHKLQDPNQRTIIVCDEKLKAVTKKKRVTCSEVLTCLGQHMTAI